MINITLYKELISILDKNNYKYIIDNKHSKECIAVGIGDILFKLLNLQENLVEKPIYINLDLFQNGKFKMNDNSESKVWFDEPFNNFCFRIDLLNDIIKHSIFFEKKDFIFIITDYKAALISKTNINFNFKQIKNFNLLLHNDFYKFTFNKKLTNFIKNPYIIFHTKLRLNHSYDYKKIKNELDRFFSGLKIHNFNIILLGERHFKPTEESKIQGITTIYHELLKLNNYNSSKILDLTKDEIYNKLNYYNYKKDLCLIKNAKWNICIGQGGQLCSSLAFGKTIFYDPIDHEVFYDNKNLFNSGHIYYKNLLTFCNFLIQKL
jgi:hypothetical protein